jgi:hypothetical protein
VAGREGPRMEGASSYSDTLLGVAAAGREW